MNKKLLLRFPQGAKEKRSLRSWLVTLGCSLLKLGCKWPEAFPVPSQVFVELCSELIWLKTHLDQLFCVVCSNNLAACCACTWEGVIVKWEQAAGSEEEGSATSLGKIAWILFRCCSCRPFFSFYHILATWELLGVSEILLGGETLSAFGFGNRYHPAPDGNMNLVLMCASSESQASYIRLDEIFF